MIIVVVAFNVAEENTARFEDVMNKLAATSLANEPGTLTYELGRSESDPEVYRLVELYQDQAALDAHMKSAWLAEAGKEMGALLKSRPDIQRFVSVRNPG